MKKELIGLITRMLSELSHKAFVEYVADNDDFKRLLKNDESLEREYLALDLRDDQREVIEKLLQSRLDVEQCSLPLMYVADHMNALLALSKLGFLDNFDS